ncbi:MAG: peptidyl-prolyl cis-trans isomerase [Oscillospiraceae bacterium]|jgi:hypothetical protein|nr:peptidyl-prolyl cis-trans isomerase [Oscillospiraceae bacterium]
MKKTRKLVIPAIILLLAAGITAGATAARGRVVINGGYAIERDVYELLRNRVSTDEAVMRAHARYSALFALGYEEGLTDFGDMPGFLKSLKKENARRSDALRNDRTVFGLTRFSESDYLDYIVSNLLLRLPERLVENGTLSVSENDFENFYNEHKEEKYRYVARATVEILELDSGREDLDAVIASIERDILDGADFTDIMAKYDPERGPFELTIKENTKTHSGFAELYELAVASEPNSVGGPRDIDGRVFFYRLLNYEEGGVTSFENALFYVKKDVINQKFERFLQGEIQKLIGHGASEQ